MPDITYTLRRYAFDAIVISLATAASIACWVYQLPVWMLAICLIVLLFALISLLGDLGLFGGQQD